MSQLYCDRPRRVALPVLVRASAAVISFVWTRCSVAERLTCRHAVSVPVTACSYGVALQRRMLVCVLKQVKLFVLMRGRKGKTFMLLAAHILRGARLNVASIDRRLSAQTERRVLKWARVCLHLSPPLSTPFRENRPSARRVPFHSRHVSQSVDRQRRAALN